MKNVNSDIIVLISTKLNESYHNTIKNEIEGEILFNSNEVGGRGVLIWVRNKNKPIEVKELYRDTDGNILIVEINYDINHCVMCPYKDQNEKK